MTYSITQEKTDGAIRYGVYNQETGTMKVMGLGGAGKARAQNFLAYEKELQAEDRRGYPKGFIR